MTDPLHALKDDAETDDADDVETDDDDNDDESDDERDFDGHDFCAAILLIGVLVGLIVLGVKWIQWILG